MLLFCFLLFQALAFHTVHDFGKSVTGRPIFLEQIGSGKQVVLIVSTIHGNEWSGYPLSLRLIDELLNNQEYINGKTILILPLANPDGFALYQRNNINWVDLNRNFPANNYGKSYRSGDFALSEPESFALKKVVERFSPQRIIAIHEPLECIDYDGKGELLAKRLSEVSGLPMKRLPAYSGSLGAFVNSQLKSEFITIELPYFIHLKDPEKLWDLYGDLLIESILWNIDRAE
ncbi:MAG: hypothetical protein CMK59_12120 [Proteobacteria bacterium]|nr:hypothetical protein [Pseudomonadota bacterium]